MIKKRTKIIILIPIFLLVISLILYSLSYRYLIERDEATVINSFSSASESSDSKNQVTFDDWNYSSDSFSINIEKKKMALKMIK